jgi:hypothetical protein
MNICHGRAKRLEADWMTAVHDAAAIARQTEQMTAAVFTDA